MTIGERKQSETPTSTKKVVTQASLSYYFALIKNNISELTIISTTTVNP